MAVANLPIPSRPKSARAFLITSLETKPRTCLVIAYDVTDAVKLWQRWTQNVHPGKIEICEHTAVLVDVEGLDLSEKTP